MYIAIDIFRDALSTQEIPRSQTMRYLALIALIACTNDYGLAQDDRPNTSVEDVTLRVAIGLVNDTMWPIDTRGCIYSSEDYTCTDWYRVNGYSRTQQTVWLFVSGDDTLVSDMLEWEGQYSSGRVGWDDVFDATNAPEAYVMTVISEY